MQPLGGDLVCHVLLIETEAGLVLVDSGFGVDDAASPASRIGPSRFLTRPILDPDESALRQVERLGFSGEDVRHIIVTHFDSDHIGGLSDFPHVQVHTTAAEVLGAITEPSWRERIRYRSAQWAHGPNLVEHRAEGESWLGFAAAKELTAIAPGIVLVPLPGHTRGHTAIAVDTGDRWLLHAGDAFYHPSSNGGGGIAPLSLRLMEPLIAFDRRQVRENHERLAELRTRSDVNLHLFCAHDPVGLADAQALQADSPER